MKRLILLLLLAVFCCFAQTSEHPGASGSGISTCATNPPTTGTAGQVCVIGTSQYLCHTTGACSVAGAWTLVGPVPITGYGFTTTFTPSSSVSLTCPSQANGVFEANASLSGAVAISGITCTLPGSSSVRVQFQWVTGLTPYHVTFPTGWTSANSCDPYNASAGALVVIDGIWDGTAYQVSACSTTGTSIIPGPLIVQGALTVTTSSSPASGASCTAGTLAWDANYFYLCTASGAWKRAALTGSY